MVLPQSMVTTWQEENTPLSQLATLDRLISEVSPQELVDLHRARERFPFTFDAELRVYIARSPLDELHDSGKQPYLYDRALQRLETQRLTSPNKDTDPEKPDAISVYTLYPVNESLWVAAEQRLCDYTGDPHRASLSANRAFFDALIAQALHTLSFERVCAANLFTYYLKALPAAG